jgi:putative hemolysin
MLAFELVVVVILILLNGALALSELAVVSARPARLKAMEERGVGGARAASALNADPGRFLSTVQIGITLVGILAGAYSGATLAQRLDTGLEALGMPTVVAEPVAFILVVSIITYLSLIVGELVPKQVALRDPERAACAVAPAMALLATVAKPIVYVLDASGRLVLRLLGLHEQPEAKVTEDEIRMIVAEAETAGVIEPEERRMISGVMRLGARPVRAFMTPRHEVAMIDLRGEPEEIRAALVASPHARLPAHRGDPDEPVGIIQLRDVAAACLAGQPFDPERHVRDAPIVLDATDATDAIEVLRSAVVHYGLVHDEYGHFQGVVTPTDILEAIAGEFGAHIEHGDPDVFERADGSMLVSGSMPADAFAELLGIKIPEQRTYHTAAGLALDLLGRIPETGDAFTAEGWTFEIVDMDGRRIDKLLVRRAL